MNHTSGYGVFTLKEGSMPFPSPFPLPLPPHKLQTNYKPDAAQMSVSSEFPGQLLPPFIG